MNKCGIYTAEKTFRENKIIQNFVTYSRNMNSVNGKQLLWSTGTILGTRQNLIKERSFRSSLSREKSFKRVCCWNDPVVYRQYNLTSASLVCWYFIILHPFQPLLICGPSKSPTIPLNSEVKNTLHFLQIYFYFKKCCGKNILKLHIKT